MPLGTLSRRVISAQPLADNFNRANTGAGAGLGSSSTGNSPWLYPTGAWNILSNMATSSTDFGTNPQAVLDCGASDVRLNVATINFDSGQALYCRVKDASNWWRLLFREVTTSSTSTGTYNLNATGVTSGSACYNNDGSYSYTCGSSCSVPSCCGGGCPYYSYSYTGYCSNGSTVTCYCTRTNSGTCQMSTTTYYYNYYLSLDKCVAGSVSRVVDTYVGQSQRAYALGLRAQGNVFETFTVLSSGADPIGRMTSYATFTDTTNFNIGESKHGIGFGPSGSYNGASATSGVNLFDDFSIALL